MIITITVHTLGVVFSVVVWFLLPAGHCCFLSQNHPSSWPFRKPVDRDEVPDYYDVIRFPMGAVNKTPYPFIYHVLNWLVV